jgi:hypothetical protein
LPPTSMFSQVSSHPGWRIEDVYRFLMHF